jgi:RNA polymerase sigma-70 factor (ECF subfamily)
MASVAFLKAGLVEAGGNPEPLPESLVSDNLTIYDELVAPVEPRMMRSIWRVVRRSELAQDALQDALIVIWKKLPQIRRHPNPQALILKICLNSAYDALRKLKRIPYRTDVSALGQIPAPFADGATPTLERQELEQQVLRAIGRLPRKRAVAVMMRLVQEAPFDVIARALDCSEVTARIHVSKGRAQLRKWLHHLCPQSLQEAKK